jgi:Fe-S oxidoreductase
LQATGAGTVVMACPFCSIMLKGAQSTARTDLKMTDLASYVDERIKQARHDG